MEIDTNKEYKIKELCEMLGIPYNKKNPKLSLKKVQGKYEIEQVSKQRFKIIRELTPKEKAEIGLYSDCKKLLETAIYITLSETQKTKNGIRKDMKGFFELFNITNENYRYFTYGRLTKEKVDIINKLEFREEYDIGATNLILHQFAEDVNPILRRIVLETFYKMEDESYIFIKKHLMFGWLEIHIDEDGNSKSKHRKKSATESEIEIYMKHKRAIMEERGFNEWSKVPFFMKGELDKIACKKMDFDYSYYEYEIILNQEGLKRKVERENLPKVLEELNYSIGHKLETSNQGNLKSTKLSVKKDCIDGLIVNKEGRKE